ncbi:IS3 family transposase [Vreelandella zhanjiangensis]|uniref:IS3 family transposase n=1 Tax=Vreelandella zhanjiangensis TaxID=1121960 RepID=UPI001FC991F3|nr:IS3 family transposase [Halomonas zhanjiangensis]
MAKHNEAFKLLVVQSYAEGPQGYKSLARQYGLGPTTVRRWVKHYEQHGLSGLQKKFSHYSAEFKLAVLQQMRQEELSALQATTLFDIRGGTGVVRRWKSQYHEGGFQALEPKARGRPTKMPTTEPPKPPLPLPEKSSLEQLLQENEYLRAEVAYLKKLRAASGQRASRAEKARVVLELKQGHPLPMPLKVAELSRSTFYYQVRVQQLDDRHAGLKRRIHALYERHKGRYGYRRITAALRQAGEQVNHKTVQRLMQHLGLKSLVRPKKYRSYRGQPASVPNLLARQFQAERPNQKWVTDVTEFNVRGEKLYLSPVMDLYNGEIVSYSIQKRPQFSLVGGMLKKALAKLANQEAPLLHSDQGWQYQMPAYRRKLAEYGVIQSMSRKENCLDNAAIESFFGTLKSEYFYLNRFDNIEQLQAGIRRYIHYYNYERIKIKLKGLSPVQYRNQALAA